MNYSLRKIFGLMAVCCLAVGLMQTALAADMFYTSARVNFRVGASLESRVIKTLNTGSSVEVLEYDPANWSKVSVNGTTGYIKSEYLKEADASVESAGSNITSYTNTAYITSARVNFRRGPSLDAGVIKLLNAGTSVGVLEYDRTGWSRASIDGTTGYIKSEYLKEASVSVEKSETQEESETYITSARVNFRNGPSIDSGVIKLLNAGTSVEVLEYDRTNWSKVSVNGDVGYIKSEYLKSVQSKGTGSLELLEWSVAKTIIKCYEPIEVYDVRTGSVYYIQSFSNGNHADVEPLTKEDTDILLKTYGGKWKWDPRPVWVTIGGRTIAASINGMPHGGGTISNNGMDGQVCLHFLGSKTHNGNKSFEKSHQNGVWEAWNAR